MRSSLTRLSPAAALVTAAVALWATPASAQYYPPPPPPPGYAPASAYALPRVTGALRVGLDVPYGSAFQDMPLRNVFSPQVGLLGELGVRVSPQFTMGGYLGFGIGAAGDAYDAWCGEGLDCSSFSFRTGFMAQYHFAPYAPVNPWIGYGFGFTASVAQGDDRAYSFSYSYAGFDVAHLMGGIDLRPAGPGRVGIGFYVDYSIGLYNWYSWDENDVTIADGTIGHPKVHHWLSFGPRISF